MTPLSRDGTPSSGADLFLIQNIGPYLLGKEPSCGASGILWEHNCIENRGLMELGQ